jgi:hypothetical protein
MKLSSESRSGIQHLRFTSGQKQWSLYTARFSSHPHMLPVATNFNDFVPCHLCMCLVWITSVDLFFFSKKFVTTFYGRLRILISGNRSTLSAQTITQERRVLIWLRFKYYRPWRWSNLQEGSMPVAAAPLHVGRAEPATSQFWSCLRTWLIKEGRQSAQGSSSWSRQLICYSFANGSNALA